MSALGLPVSEEHDELFPGVRDEMPSKQLKELGATMESMFKS